MDTVIPNVLGYLEKNDKILLGLRADRSSKIYRNHRDLPGGQIEPGETVKEALRRELFEETGLLIMRARLMDAFHNRQPDEGTPGLCLLYRIEKARGTMQASSDLQALEYFNKSGIRDLQLLEQVLFEGIPSRKSCQAQRRGNARLMHMRLGYSNLEYSVVSLLSVVDLRRLNMTPTVVGPKFEDLPNFRRQFDKSYLFVVIFGKPFLNNTLQGDYQTVSQ